MIKNFLQSKKNNVLFNFYKFWTHSVFSLQKWARFLNRASSFLSSITQLFCLGFEHNCSLLIRGKGKYSENLWFIIHSDTCVSVFNFFNISFLKLFLQENNSIQLNLIMFLSFKLFKKFQDSISHEIINLQKKHSAYQ